MIVIITCSSSSLVPCRFVLSCPVNLPCISPRTFMLQLVSIQSFGLHSVLPCPSLVVVSAPLVVFLLTALLCSALLQRIHSFSATSIVTRSLNFSFSSSSSFRLCHPCYEVTSTAWKSIVKTKANITSEAELQGHL